MSPRARLCRNALLMWLVLFALAFLNGALREFALAPLLGAPALPLSGVTASLAFAIAIALFVRRARPTVAEAVGIGLAWLVLTVAVEAALIGAQGRPASAIADVFTWRTIAGGNLFAVLVAVVALAPVLFAWRLRR
jgi:hypothetical protein